ncbi:MAG TPA: hypothetical protein VH089_13630 [Streptosporangiaceae bacterium]|nr:hypothetical protein [Streptosporangiaceae bacterium]
MRGAQLGAIAITAGAIAVAGCSSSSSNNSASGQASSSASASASSGGASSGGASLTAAQAVREAAQHAQKATSYAADITVQTSGTASSTISGTLKQQTTPSPLAVADFTSVTVQGQQVPGGMEEIINSGGIYLKLAELSKQTGKPWIKIPSSDVSKLGGASLSQLLQNGSNDPLTQTQMLSSSTNVKKVGTATINGVATTEYTGTYPITAGLAKLPAAARSKIASQLQAMGLTTEHFTVWLDNQQQVRKVVSSAKGTSEQVASTVTVTSVNQPVTATLPPASQTATVPSSELGGSGTGTTTS